MQQLEEQSDPVAQISLGKLPPYYRQNNETGEITPITKAEYKRSMHDEFTVRHTVNPTCEHKVTVGYEPRHRNCEACWFAYFQVHGEVTRLADQIFQEHGEAGARQIITQLKGRQFFENYLKFMSSLAHFKKAFEHAKARDEQDAGVPGVQGSEDTLPQPADQIGALLSPKRESVQ